MTEYQKLIDTALEKFNGDRVLAAVAMGTSRGAIDSQVSKCEDLKNRWGEFAEKPVGPAIISTDEKDLILSMTKEDATLAKGLDALGLTPEESALAMQLSNFGRSQFVQSVQIASAGMTRIGIRIGTQLDEVGKRLTKVRELIEQCDGGTCKIPRSELIEEERVLMEAYVTMSEQIRRINDTAHRGMMLQAMIRYRLTRRNGAPLSIKPGYSSQPPIET
jgi:hypothetical protein